MIYFLLFYFKVQVKLIHRNILRRIRPQQKLAAQILHDIFPETLVVWQRVIQIVNIHDRPHFPLQFAFQLHRRPTRISRKNLDVKRADLAIDHRRDHRVNIFSQIEFFIDLHELRGYLFTFQDKVDPFVFHRSTFVQFHGKTQDIKQFGAHILVLFIQYQTKRAILVVIHNQNDRTGKYITRDIRRRY